MSMLKDRIKNVVVSCLKEHGISLDKVAEDVRLSAVIMWDDDTDVFTGTLDIGDSSISYNFKVKLFNDKLIVEKIDESIVQFAKKTIYSIGGEK